MTEESEDSSPLPPSLTAFAPHSGRASLRPSLFLPPPCTICALATSTTLCPGVWPEGLEDFTLNAGPPRPSHRHCQLPLSARNLPSTPLCPTVFCTVLAEAFGSSQCSSQTMGFSLHTELLLL